MSEGRLGKLKREWKNSLAFEELGRIIMRAVLGSLDPGFYIMEASVGLGKSKAVQNIISRWENRKAIAEGGILICLSTLDEIESYCDGCKFDSEDYAVSSSDKGLNGFGRGKAGADMARVLFTTHEGFWRKMATEGSFTAASAFSYRGKPRRLVIWDESLPPAQGTTIRYDHLTAFPSAARHLAPRSTDIVEAALPGNPLLKHDLIVEVPERLRSALKEVEEAIGQTIGEDAASARAIRGLTGAIGTSLVARHYNHGAWHLIGPGRALPFDMPPTVVLDASAGIRTTYKVWQKVAGNVTMLPPAKASYEALTLHWWSRGCSKSSLGDWDKRHEVIGVIAALINARPGERWLIVHPKDRVGKQGAFAIPKELVRLLAEPENVQFVNWGRHLATNKFREITNVVILGEHGYSEGHIDALGMAANDGLPVDKPTRDTFLTGAAADNIYQAIGRSNVRNVVGGVAGAATVYLITPRTPAKEATLMAAMEGCTVEEWTPVASAKPTKAQRLIGELNTIFNVEGQINVQIKDLALRCGGKGGGYLTLMWKDAGVKAYLKSQGITRVKQRLWRVSMLSKAA